MDAMEFILTPLPDEGLELCLQPHTSAYELLDAVKREGIRVRITSVKGNQVRIGVEAPFCLQVGRFEAEK
ncbi:carbon storage regulator [Pseudomonas sp. C9-3]|uniref:carbon storage regulator n=1 Tax=Pseudomonas sp. C9-3 TaxID=3078264 RepID=UPI0039647D8A